MCLCIDLCMYFYIHRCNYGSSLLHIVFYIHLYIQFCILFLGFLLHEQ